MSHATMSFAKVTVGLDLGDRYSQFCMLDADSGVIEEGRFRTTATGRIARRSYGCRPEVARTGLDLPRFGGQEVKPLFEVHTPLG